MTTEMVLFGLAVLAVVAGCLAPKHWLPPLPNDKVLHFSAFAALSLLAARIASTPLELAGWLFGLLVAGWLIECVQQWIPGRSFCWRDIAANAAGIAAAALCVPLLPWF
ncbi:MAG TPA: VanZ family protein [Burkholderiaceae bacterium]